MQLGARWDPRQKVWYVPDGVDPAPLRRWLPLAQRPTIRSASYFLATTVRQCWRCCAQTHVWAIMLPAGHEVLYVEDDPTGDHWELIDEPTLLSYRSTQRAPPRQRQLDYARYSSPSPHRAGATPAESSCSSI